LISNASFSRRSEWSIGLKPYPLSGVGGSQGVFDHSPGIAAVNAKKPPNSEVRQHAYPDSLKPRAAQC